jgi:hypothetical protein
LKFDASQSYHLLLVLDVSCGVRVVSLSNAQMPNFFEELCCRCECVLCSLGILTVSIVVAICNAKERKKKVWMWIDGGKHT